MRFGRPYNRETVRYYGAQGSNKGLILAFHGLGGSPKQLESNSGLNSVGDQTNCAVVYIQSLWKFWRFWGPTDNWHMKRDFTTVNKVLDNTPHDPLRVYVAGFSAGANFALRLGLMGGLPLHPLDGVICYAGEFKVVEQNATSDLRLPRLLSIGNKEDRLVPYESNAVKLREWWKQYHWGSSLMQGANGHQWDKGLNPYISQWIRGEAK